MWHGGTVTYTYELQTPDAWWKLARRYRVKEHRVDPGSGTPNAPNNASAVVVRTHSHGTSYNLADSFDYRGHEWVSVADTAGHTEKAWPRAPRPTPPVRRPTGAPRRRGVWAPSCTGTRCAATSLGTLLAGKTVGIVGLGRIGANVARRLTGWDARVLAADPFVEPALAYAVGAELVPLDELVRESDFITVHVVLIPETRHMIDEARLRMMKPTAYLVNTSRGGAIDETALVRAIEEEWIAGVALDVFENEPLPLSSPLRRLDPDRVILTPHVLSNTLAQRVSGTRVVAQNVLRALRGELPTFIKNPAAIDRWRQRCAALDAAGSAVAAASRQ